MGWGGSMDTELLIYEMSTYLGYFHSECPSERVVSTRFIPLWKIKTVPIIVDLVTTNLELTHRLFINESFVKRFVTLSGGSKSDRQWPPPSNTSKTRGGDLKIYIYKELTFLPKASISHPGLGLVYKQTTKQQPTELFTRKTVKTSMLPDYQTVVISFKKIKTTIEENESLLEAKLIENLFFRHYNTIRMTSRFFCMSFM
ncbi:Uncharacterized protein FWK35_00007731, partial [Aphis craccivora]